VDVNVLFLLGRSLVGYVLQTRGLTGWDFCRTILQRVALCAGVIADRKL